MSVAKIEMLSAKVQYIICMKIRVDNFVCNYCPIHLVTFTLISILATDYIQKRRGQTLLLSFEYNL